MPEVTERLARGMHDALLLLFLALRLGHLIEGDDDGDGYHHEADGDVGVTDDGQVVNADIGFLGLRERAEDNLSGSVAAVADEVR